MLVRPTWAVCTTALIAAIGLTLVALSHTSYAQESSGAQGVVEEVEETTEVEESTGDAKPDAAATATPEETLTYSFNTIVMFICGVLVLFMQAGFAMLETGLNAAKNAVNILAKNFLDMAVGVLLFIVIGFGLMFPGAAYKGGFWGYAGTGIYGLGYAASQPNAADIATGYSQSAFFIFQVAFAATAATIVSGAVAGRLRFGAYLLYSALISGLVYPMSGMWTWGGGWLTDKGFMDFAGSVVVHAVGGFAGLAGAIMLGPRIGRYVNGKSVAMPGHNITVAALGVFILWVGWYGFNPGSQLTYYGTTGTNITAYIAVTTTLAGAAGTVVSLILAWILFKKPDLTMALNGALAGLVAITANCNQVSLRASLLIGAIAGVLVVLGVILLDKLHIDDPVGAWPVHGLCGMWGGIATGIFGQEGAVLSTQIIGTLVISAWSFFTMLAFFGFLKAIGFLRVGPAEELEGLDLSEHGMHAYPPQWITDETPGTPLGSVT